MRRRPHSRAFAAAQAPGAPEVHGLDPPKRVVIVDDARSIRAWLRVILNQNPRLIVVGEAACAVSARQVIKETAPDVVTLDIEMPEMNGLDFLDKLMRLHPLPVVMISGATRAHSDTTFQAFSRGAVDCILKPLRADDPLVHRDIAHRVLAAARRQAPYDQAYRPVGAKAAPRARPQNQPLILIGASTGGVNALEYILAGLHPNGPPVVIVQHMPAAFLGGFTDILNRKLPQDIGLATAAEPLETGQIRFAPSIDQHTEIYRENSTWACRFCRPDGKVLHCPSVDRLFASAASHGADIIAVILTGLGRDGARGMQDLRRAGAVTIGQDAKTSVVYGMPRAAWEMGGVGRQVALDDIAETVNMAAIKHNIKQGEIGR
jgi:two-component system chemotaxis response regulator CheB